jgi:hypothetical protein
MSQADDARRVHAERATSVRERWGANDGERMTRLAHEFPSLAEADGVDPWHLEALVRWAMQPDLPVMAMHAVRFLLHVWSSDKDWGITPFKFADAFREWDEAHRAAVIAWCEAPFHPGP